MMCIGVEMPFEAPSLSRLGVFLWLKDLVNMTAQNTNLPVGLKQAKNTGSFYLQFLALAKSSGLLSKPKGRVVQTPWVEDEPAY